MELKTINSGTERIRKVLTILNKEGENIAYLVIPYDKNSSVSVKQIIIYDGTGKKIKNVKQSEITDSPSFGSSELFAESRIKYYMPNNSVYPYTILYEYELDLKNIISYGSWRPFTTFNVSTQHSRLTSVIRQK